MEGRVLPGAEVAVGGVVGDGVAVGGVTGEDVAVAVAVAGSDVEVEVATVAGLEVRVAVGGADCAVEVGKAVAEGRGLAVGPLNGAHLSVAVFLSLDSLTVKDVEHVAIRVVFGSSDIAAAKERASAGCPKAISPNVASAMPMKWRLKLPFTI